MPLRNTNMIDDHNVYFLQTTLKQTNPTNVREIDLLHTYNVFRLHYTSSSIKPVLIIHNR